MKIFWWTPRFNVFIENIFVVTSLLIEQNFERAPMQRNTCSSGGFPCKKRTIGIRTIERTKTTMTIGICCKPGRIEEWPWRAPSRRHQMQQSPDVQQLETRKRSKALATSLVARFDMRAVPYSTSFGVSPSRALTATWNKTRWNWSFNSPEFKSHLGCDPDVGEGDATPRCVPFRDVEQPFRGGTSFKEVAEQSSNLWSVWQQQQQLWEDLTMMKIRRMTWCTSSCSAIGRRSILCV